MVRLDFNHNSRIAGVRGELIEEDFISQPTNNARNTGELHA